MRRALLISDLHLEPEAPAITTAFFRFLSGIPKEVDGLFILGDFFEVWIGDDDSSALATEVAERLLKLSRQGIGIYLMHGNRDFLIGADYARRCGAQLIEEPYTLSIGDQRALLIHGDSLCTDDEGYMAFRDTVRAADWQAQFLAKPLADRRAFARQARAQSEQDTANKEAGIMDVNQQAVAQLLATEQHELLIHGHTHRPAVHEVNLNGQRSASRTAKRVVLGDWGAKVWYACMDEDGVELVSYSAESEEVSLLGSS